MQIDRTVAPLFLAGPSSASRPMQAKTHEILVIVFIACACLCSSALAYPEAIPQAASSGDTRATNDDRDYCVVTTQESGEGNKLLRTGRFMDARPKLQEAFDKLKARNAASVEIACVMNLIGLAEQRALHADDAVEWFERALRLDSLPEGLVAIVTCNLASAYLDLNRPDRAEEVARRAWALADRVFGADHPATLTPQITLSLVYASREEHARAEPILRRILHQSERIWGASSYQAAYAGINLADIYYNQRRFSLAAELLQKAIATLQQSLNRDASDLPLTQSAMAVCSAAGRRARDTDMWLQRASASMQDLAPTDPVRAVILERSAIARFYLKDVNAGRQLFEQSIAFLDSYYGAGSPESLGALERYADTLRAAKDKSGAKKVEARRNALSSRR